jgi:hypothetical protein
MQLKLALYAGERREKVKGEGEEGERRERRGERMEMGSISSNKI